MPDDNAKVLPYGKFEGVRSDYKVEIERRNEAWCCYSYICHIVPDIWFVRHQGAFVRCKICTSYQMRIPSLAVLKNASNWKCCVSIDRFFSIIATHLCKFQTICPDFESLEQETAKAFHQSPKNRSQVPRIQKMQAAEIFLKFWCFLSLNSTHQWQIGRPFYSAPIQISNGSVVLHVTTKFGLSMPSGLHLKLSMMQQFQPQLLLLWMME